MKTLCHIMLAVCLAILATGCKQMEAWERHSMAPMGDSVRLATEMQKVECPPVIGEEMMNGDKQILINNNYIQDNDKKLSVKSSTTSTDAFKVSRD